MELLVAKVLPKLGMTGADVIKVSDERHIVRYITLDAIPGLVIKGKSASQRGVPDEATLTAWLSQAAAGEAAVKL